MKHIEGYFHNDRHARIYYQAWLPETAAKAALLIVHGLGEHSGRYAKLAAHFVALGYAVYGFDHIGHGRSEGARLHVERFDEFTDTLGEFCDKVGQWQAGVPLFFLGHSMGGLIAADNLLRGDREVTGAILSAPSMKAGDSVAPATIWLGKRLSIIAPKFRILAIDRGGISRDPAVLAACANDPLMSQDKFTARLGVELLKAMRRVQAQAHEITLPFIVLQGGADPIVDPSGAQWFYDNAGSEHKVLKIYPGLYHEVFNEPERAVVLKDMEEWLAAWV